MIKAVLFDLDGTLVNSLGDLADAGNVAVAHFGVAPYNEEQYKYFVGDGMVKLVERILPPKMRERETVEKCFKIFYEYYSRHYADKTVAYDGLPQLIGTLKGKGILTAVVTNKAQEMAELIVKRCYGDSFDVILGKTEHLPLKPNPASLLEVCRRLGINAYECAFVGDSGMDMEAAVRAEMYPIGVLWGFRKADELLSCGAKALASDASELNEHLNAL